MKLVSHKELHNEWMQDDEYRAAWQEEERKEKLRELLAEWRKHDNLTKAQVAERMGLHLRLFLAWKTTSPKPASTH
jgi:hypothetical protein